MSTAALASPLPAARRRRSAHPVRDAALAWGLRGLAFVLAVLVVVWARQVLFADGARPHNRVQRVALVSTQRPPPPKPPEKLPEPVREAEARLEQPVVTPTQRTAPPIGEHLGVDSDAKGAGDDYGIVGRRGGRDITTLGGDKPAGAIGTASSSLERFRHYAGIVSQRLRVALSSDSRLVAQEYVVSVQIWIGGAGSIVRVDFERGSGNPAVDSALRDVLARAGPLPDPPPDLPFPIRLRIESREVARSGR